MACNPNYPTAFPGECVASAIIALKSANVGAAIDAGYVVVGYGLGVARSTVLVGSPGPLTTEQRSQLSELRDLLEDGPGVNADVSSQLTLFWHETIVPVLKSLLNFLLANLN